MLVLTKNLSYNGNLPSLELSANSCWITGWMASTNILLLYHFWTLLSSQV